MSVTVGFLALLEAKPDKADELAAFLEQGRELALAEPLTVDWYAFRIDQLTYGIFDTFEAEADKRSRPGAVNMDTRASTNAGVAARLMRDVLLAQSQALLGRQRGRFDRCLGRDRHEHDDPRSRHRGLEDRRSPRRRGRFAKRLLPERSSYTASGTLCSSLGQARTGPRMRLAAEMDDVQGHPENDVRRRLGIGVAEVDANRSGAVPARLRRPGSLLRHWAGDRGTIRRCRSAASAGRDTAGVDREDPAEFGEDAEAAGLAPESSAVAPELPSVKIVPLSELEAGNPKLEEVASDLAGQAEEVILEDAPLGRVVPENPAALPELPSVEIVSLSELDPSSTALEPEVFSGLARRADEVILDAATRESSVVDPPDAASPLLEEAFDSSNPPGAGRGPDRLGAAPGDSAEICVRTFPAVASSAAAARNLAAQAVADIPADAVEEIRLMVSELASNAIEHAMTGFRLRIHRSRQEIRVEVTDGGGGTPAMRSPGRDAPKGRGLQIVNVLSTHWGVERESDSAKTVWFTLEFAPTAGPTPSA